MTLGEKIFQFRVNHRLSLRKLANLIGEHYNTLWRYEKKRVKKPHKTLEFSILNKLNKIEKEFLN